MAQKKRVLVLYGGQSSEHQVSLISALSVLRHLDRERFDVISAGIDLEGKLWIGDSALVQKTITDPSQRTLPELARQVPVTLRDQQLVTVSSENHLGAR